MSFRFDGKILADLFLCNRRLIPPHQSLTRQLPPKGKPFQNPPHFFTTGRTSGSSEACLLLYFCLFLEYFCLLPEIVFIMFARAYKRLPLGGKLSRKRLMRGDKSALTKGIHAPYVPPPIGCEAALCKVSHLPICQKLPCTATAAFKTEKNFADRNGGCRAGKFGEMREVWRGKRPLRKGSLPPPRSSSPLHEPLRRDEGVAEKHRDGHRTDAARDGRDEGAERGNRGEVHVTH